MTGLRTLALARRSARSGSARCYRFGREVSVPVQRMAVAAIEDREDSAEPAAGWPRVAVLGLAAAAGYAAVETYWSVVTLPWQVNVTAVLVMVVLGALVAGSALALRRNPAIPPH
jgi:hypothetical protein